MLPTEITRAAVRFEGKLLFWGNAIDRFAIAERKLERSVRGVINFALLIFSVGGFLALLYALFPQPQAVVSADFWLQSGRWEVMYFLFSLWTNAYLWYRMIKESETKTSVQKREYGGTEETTAPQEVEWAEVERAGRGDKIDISQSFSADAVSSVEEAYQLTQKFGHGQVTPIHLLGGLVRTSMVGLLMARLGISGQTMRERIERAFSGEGGASGPVLFAPEATQAIFDSYTEAFNARQSRVRPTELLLSIVRQDGKVQELFCDLGSDVQKVENVVAWVRMITELREQWSAGRKRARFRPKGPVNRAMTSLATPFLDQLSDDLTTMAQGGFLPPFIERESLMDQVFRVMEGGRASVLLVGHPGTGKEALLFGIAERMVEETVPSVLSDKRLVSISVPKIISGATPAEAAERLEAIFFEAARSGNIVFAIPRVEGLVGITAGGEQSLDLSDVLLDGLQKYGILAIATTTPEADVQSLQRTALGQKFEKISVTEPDVNEAIRILEAKAGGIEFKNKVFFSYDSIERAVTLSSRYMQDRFLPEKAIEIMKEVAHAVRSKKGEKSVVTSEDVAIVVSEKSKIPVTAITEDEQSKLLNLEENMHQRMVGQDTAVSAVSRALRRARTELRAEDRPIANFLFLGPTGVGKTEMAKTTAEVYFGSDENMIRLDMSEYQDQQSLHRLIGVPGSNKGGVLTEAVRAQPFALLLLDELEKANKDVINVFLQVMDDGRLTDALGRTVDFTNVILIATSNAGTQYIQDAVKQGTDFSEIKDTLMNRELREIFRPEFLNRFDDIIVFAPLTKDEIQEIARRMLVGVAKQLESRGITLQVTEDAVKELAEEGFDPVFGARPLRRVIQERVQDALASFLLEQKLGRRDVVIFGAGGQITVNKAERL